MNRTKNAYSCKFGEINTVHTLGPEVRRQKELGQKRRKKRTFVLTGFRNYVLQKQKILNRALKKKWVSENVVFFSDNGLQYIMAKTTVQKFTCTSQFQIKTAQYDTKFGLGVLSIIQSVQYLLFLQNTIYDTTKGCRPKPTVHFI